MVTVTLRRFSSSKGEEYSDEDYEDYLKNYVDFDWRDATYEKYVEWCENWGYEPKEVE